MTVLTVRARDGDTGQPRPLLLNLENEDMGYFRLEVSQQGDLTLGRLITTNVSLDREDPSILQNGGIYTFEVRATELINNEIPADTATSMVTIVVTDVDDMVPQFNEEFFNLKISEDIGTDTPLPGEEYENFIEKLLCDFSFKFIFVKRIFFTGLNMLVTDDDVGENAKYQLALRDAPDYPDISAAFIISPEEGQGRVPIVIRASDESVLDYDIPGNRELEFEVTASVNDEVVSAKRITLIWNFRSYCWYILIQCSNYTATFSDNESFINHELSLT